VAVPVQKISIEPFLSLAGEHLVLDVRSPGEYAHAHIPGAYNLPLFSDEERKTVGTTYKQQSREAAIKSGLDFFGARMKKMVEEAESLVAGQPPAPTLLLHCWRGGMRSAAVAWLLDLYGFRVRLLAGGYKAYRKWVLAQFEKTYDFHVIGGYTGSGKTLLLHELAKQGKRTIDLEALAHHKGSAFGALGEPPQPKQEMFENLLAKALRESGQGFRHPGSPAPDPGIFIEDESQRIGNLQIPMPLWNGLRRCPVYFLDIPFEERLSYLAGEYGKFEKEKLVNAVLRIQKRLGGLETRNAVNHLIENNHRECFRILLTYYDKWYTKALFNRENPDALLNKIPCKNVDALANTQKIIACNLVNAS
jgi:tRNA 2-selenouridine synthase